MNRNSNETKAEHLDNRNKRRSLADTLRNRLNQNAPFQYIFATGLYLACKHDSSGLSGSMMKFGPCFLSFRQFHNILVWSCMPSFQPKNCINGSHYYIALERLFASYRIDSWSTHSPAVPGAGI